MLRCCGCLGGECGPPLLLHKCMHGVLLLTPSLQCRYLPCSRCTTKACGCTASRKVRLPCTSAAVAVWGAPLYLEQAVQRQAARIPFAAGFVVQGGDVVKGDGSGGDSIYGGKVGQGAGDERGEAQPWRAGAATCTC